VIPVRVFAGQDVAVFGLDAAGIAAARALIAGGALVHAWDDSPARRAGAEAGGLTLSDFNARDWRSFAALVLSPSTAAPGGRANRVAELARAVGAPVIGELELFARAVTALAPHMRPKVVGVTGADGGALTAALIAHILRAIGRDVREGGDGHAPLLAMKPLHAGAHYVLHLNSAQLEGCETLRCDVASALGFLPSALERPGAFDQALAGMRKIFDNQGAGDWAVIGVDDPWGAEVCTWLKASARTVAPVANGQAVARGVSALGGILYDSMIGRTETVMRLADAPALKGGQDGRAAAAAYAACRALGAPPGEIARAAASFTGLPHRMERLGVVEGAVFINDSHAEDAAGAAVALGAAKAQAPDAGLIWIGAAGVGAGAGPGMEALIQRLSQTQGAFVFGPNAEEAAAALARRIPQPAKIAAADTLDQAVRAAFALARGQRATVLYSPGAPVPAPFSDGAESGQALRAFVVEIAALAAARGAA
jgi:UDP-N-acetylmuramoylalanine--D-glutamate ligase